MSVQPTMTAVLYMRALMQLVSDVQPLLASDTPSIFQLGSVRCQAPALKPNSFSVFAHRRCRTSTASNRRSSATRTLSQLGPPIRQILRQAPVAGFLLTAGIPRLGPQGLQRLQQAQTALLPAAAAAQGRQHSQTALRTPRQQGTQRRVAVAQ